MGKINTAKRGTLWEYRFEAAKVGGGRKRISKGGLRLGEAFGVTWDDIDFDVGTLKVNQQVQWDEKVKIWYFSDPKYNSYRTITPDHECM